VRPIRQEKVHHKWAPGESPLPVTIIPTPNLKDFVSVTIFSPQSGVQEITLHHPIGETRLADEVWIISSPTEVQELLRNRVDPNVSAIQARRDNYVVEWLVASSLLEQDSDDGQAYFQEKALPRPFTKYRELHKFPKLWEKVPEAEREAYLSANETIKESIRDSGVTLEAAKAFPSHFETCSGPLSNKPQVNVSALDGLSAAEVIGRIRKGMVTAPPPLPQKAVMPPLLERKPPVQAKLETGRKGDQHRLVKKSSRSHRSPSPEGESDDSDADGSN